MKPTSQSPATDKPDLVTVVSEVLGDLAFMVTDFEVSEPPAGAVWMQGEVRFYGPTEGIVRCWCTRKFAAQLAANLLGIEPGTGEAQDAAPDAVREFMNVLCGHLVTAWHGTESLFDLSIPNICDGPKAPQSVAAEADSHCWLSLDGEPLLCAYGVRK